MRELERRFRIIAFDWDGTAVANRAADATPVRRILERLLHAGVQIVVITGTNSGNVDRQFASAFCGPHKRRLFLATNRGSEVFGFDEDCRMVPLQIRQADEAEERLLDQVAEAVRDEISRRAGVAIDIIYNRVNRRKVDLIPVPQWHDPPKDQLPELVRAVEERLSGMPGGLKEALDLALRICAEQGLSEARITSDVKHLEIGLTDKRDSMAWILRELAQPQGIPPEDILIGGDEFGPIAGFPGSDSLMIQPEFANSVYVSVGPEPGGAPPPVIHLGGGPPRFWEVLADQAARHPVDLPGTPSPDATWVVVENGFVPAREHEVESIHAFGNGYVGCRDSLMEGSPLSRPATFLAGMFHQPPELSIPTFMKLPDWAAMTISVGGEALRLDVGDFLDHSRILDMQQAVLWRTWRHRDPAGRITHIRGMRFASQDDRRILVHSAVITPENWSGTLELEGNLPGPVAFPTGRGHTAAMVAGGQLELPQSWERVNPEDGRARVRLEVQIGKSYRLDRLVALRTSRDTDEPEFAAVAHLHRALSTRGVDGLVQAHRRAWANLWNDADVRLHGADPFEQRGLRFALYHLLSAVNPEDDRVSIGARALSGEGYKGHVFWDTEIFLLPFYIATVPAAARALLMYRYHTLPAARGKAEEMGYRGALYPWESADTGEEVTPKFVLAPDGVVVPVLVGTQEQHISADVAYAVWQYWQTTGDDAFMLEAGAEMILETARFWASRVEQGDDDLFHIRCVIGPDEFHESVDDSAYTNGMAAWNLRRAADLARTMPERWPDWWGRLGARIGLRAEEPSTWTHIADRMYTGFDPTTKLFEQHRGYHELEEIDLAQFRPRTAPLDLVIGRQRLERSQAIKQADVVMLIWLLWDEFRPEVREANFRYYEPRCAHDSSLSPAMHALVAARLGDMDTACRYFRRTIEIDLANNMGNAADGVHIAALGGLWQAAVFGFAGLQLTPGGPRLDPRLPAGWQAVEFSLQWRGQRYPLRATAARPTEARR